MQTAVCLPPGTLLKVVCHCLIFEGRKLFGHALPARPLKPTRRNRQKRLLGGTLPDFCCLAWCCAALSGHAGFGLIPLVSYEHAGYVLFPLVLHIISGQCSRLTAICQDTQALVSSLLCPTSTQAMFSSLLCSRLSPLTGKTDRGH